MLLDELIWMHDHLTVINHHKNTKKIMRFDKNETIQKQ